MKNFSLFTCQIPPKGSQTKENQPNIPQISVAVSLKYGSFAKNFKFLYQFYRFLKRLSRKRNQLEVSYGTSMPYSSEDPNLEDQTIYREGRGNPYYNQWRKIG